MHQVLGAKQNLDEKFKDNVINVIRMSKVKNVHHTNYRRRNIPVHVIGPDCRSFFSCRIVKTMVIL